MAQLRDIVFDAVHPASMARFWAEALDGFSVAPYDDAERARLAAAGVTDLDDDPTVLVQGPDHLLCLWFQRVPETEQTKNRLHLDLRADDPKQELKRLSDLGATVAAEQPSEHVFVLSDPEGNEFCLYREGSDAADGKAKIGSTAKRLREESEVAEDVTQRPKAPGGV